MALADERARDSWCFVCGPDNPAGLHIDFKIKNQNIYAEFIPERIHQGYDGVVHGGILATLLDEAMANLLYMRGIDCTTGRMEVRYRKPALVGSKIQILGAMLEKRSKYAKTKAVLLNLPENRLTIEEILEAHDAITSNLSKTTDLIIAEATAIFMLGARPQ